jgi:hypothetical protein
MSKEQIIIRNSLFVIRYSTCQNAKSVRLDRQMTVLVFGKIDIIPSRQQIVKQLPLLGLAGNNPASRRENKYPDP